MYKSLIDSKPLHIRFDKIDEFVRVYDGTRQLVLFRSKIYDSIHNRIRYFITVKNSITYRSSHNYAKNQSRFMQSLPPVKPITFHNVIILYKSV